LNNLKGLISKQIKDGFKNSLEIITKAKILEQMKKQKIDDLPENLIDQEVKNLSRSMKEEDIKKNMKSLKDEASKRIKTSLILSAFGDEKKIQVSEQEMNSEVAKQMGMMPGQEKIVQEYYQKNPAALDSLRGSIYEQKIINEIKNTAQPNKKEITKEQAEKILKEENEKNLKKQTKFTSLVSNDDKQKKEKKVETKNIKSTSKDSKQTAKKKKVTKKVSKK
jgi:FKBP-type peptidyl-prolyl cis-trans isomerase (trigger factor)